MVMPAQTFRFCDKMKHKDIVLSENNTRAKHEVCHSRLVMVKPNVSSLNSCKTVFKIHSLFTVGVGLCIQNIVSENGYEYKCKLYWYADATQHGTFVIDNNGYCSTHNNPHAKTAFKYSAGDSIAVVWNPSTREVSWNVVGTDKRHVVSVPSEHLRGLLHFVVEMANSDVSVTA